MKAEQKKISEQDSQLLKEWQRTKQLTTNTIQLYTTTIQHYTTATQMTLTQLYTEAITEEENNTPPRLRKIKTHLLDFHDYLDQTTLAESTKNTAIYIIKSFYKSMDIQIPEIPNNYDNTPQTKNTEKMINKEIIQIMLDNASIRNKAIINFTTMTGQSPNEVAHLSIRDIIDAWNTTLTTPIFTVEDVFQYQEEILDLEAVPLRIHRLKTRNNYWCYLPSETSRYIIEYLHQRQAGRNEKIRITSLDDNLFVNKKGEPCTRQNISKVFTVVGEKCGFEEPEHFDQKTRYLLTREEGQQRIYCAYKFRKYFLNTCRRYAGTRPETDSDNVYQGKELGDFWIGHQDRGSISHYLQYNEDDVRELREHYLQMLPYLSVEMEVDVVTSQDKKEFLAMKAKYDEMVSEMEELREYVRHKQRLHTLAREYGLE
jgi:integrase